MSKKEKDLNWLGNKVLGSNKSTPITTAQRPSSESEIGESTPRRNSTEQSQLFEQGPPPSTTPGYIPYYLKSLIGKNVKAEFLLGTSQFMDKTGILREVGINYFVLEDYVSRARIMCDLYSVRFVTTL